MCVWVCVLVFCALLSMILCVHGYVHACVPVCVPVFVCTFVNVCICVCVTAELARHTCGERNNLSWLPPSCFSLLTLHYLHLQTRDPTHIVLCRQLTAFIFNEDRLTCYNATWLQLSFCWYHCTNTNTNTDRDYLLYMWYTLQLFNKYIF